jgi:protein tyrosine phosphatase
VFKLKNINSKRNILFAINPSEPIRTHAYNQFTVLNQAAFRDGMALWIVIVISIISTLILLLIIAALVTLIVVKYKPKSRFRKAAQIVTSQQLNGHHGCASRTNIKSPIESSSKTTFNNDYTGMFMNDFVEPGEFSRYDMTNIWLVKHANGDLILDEEYRNLPDYRNLKTSYASQSHRNEIKNRFLDIKAYDDSRVILDINTIGGGNCFTVSTSISQKNANDTNSQSSVDKSIISSMSTSTSSNNSHDLDHHLSNDYINANFIQGYSHENKFIATQGPKKETINDFWLMIWQYRVTAIVMLTKLVEKGVERCTQYWPEKLNISEIYGDFEVTMKDQQKCGDYLKRTFELICLAKTTTNNLTSLTMTPGSVKNNNKRPLIVTQYYYPEWPDKDTPSTDPMSILHLIRDVNLNHLKYQYPIVVHCSAGVGRTGTYITLDAMMEKINTENKIDIYGFISKIRERRQYLVQTSKQYVFIHEALYEYCLYGFTDVEASRLVSHYKYLNDLSPTNAMGVAYQNSNKSRLQIEFEKINNAFTPNCQAREAFSSDNKHRNRYLNTICYDENRIKLSALNGSTYINATKVKGYEAYNEVIITQDPMFNTVFEFWKMITEYECNIIVCLNKDFEFVSISRFFLIFFYLIFNFNIFFKLGY